MDYFQILISSFAVATVYILFAVGAVGAFVPIIPGPTIAFAGVLAYKLILPQDISWACVLVSLVITAAAQVLDFAMSWIGAKKFGATWRGATGALVGALVGVFIPPPLLWIFIGPFIGAFVAEYAGGAAFKSAGKAGFGAFLGSIFASVGKFVSVVAMAAIFTLDILR